MQSEQNNQGQQTSQKPKIMKNINNYVIFEERLGFGQFSTVHRAMDKNDKTHQTYYACKIIPFSKIPVSKQPEYKELLQKEIDILTSAKHPNLIQLYDMKQSTNNVYLFLDFCNGGDLKSFLNSRGGRLSEIQATQFFKEMIDGYKVLHSKNIIHRDLKPENIMLHNGRVKIGDFGFARVIYGDMNQAQRMTQKCSPLYAPAQLLEDQAYSSKCDVWSMGIMFYEMLYGETPFTAQSMNGLVEDIKYKTLNGNSIKFPKHIIISDQAKDIISRMLTYSEQDRYSWEDVFKHPIFHQNVRKSRILDFEPGKSQENAINKSFEKHFNSISNKIVSDQNFLQIEFEQFQPMDIEGAEGDNDEMYGDYMQKIKMQEAKNQIAQKIDSYINFLRNRTLYANTSLLNFWNSFQQNETIQPAVKCQILICLCGYYNFSLKFLQAVMNGEVQQNVFSEGHFKFYQKSPLFEKMKNLINVDANEADILYNELNPLCFNEIKMKVDSEQDPQIKNYFIQFVQNTNLYAANQNYDAFVQEFQPIIKKTFDILDINNQNHFDKNSLKSLYMLLIFQFMDNFFDFKNFLNFDFHKFYDDQLNNQSTEQLRQNIQNLKQKM